MRAAIKKLQKLVKSAPIQEHRKPRLGIEALRVAKQNRVVAKARWEAKKNRLSLEYLSPLILCFHYRSIQVFMDSLEKQAVQSHF